MTQLSERGLRNDSPKLYKLGANGAKITLGRTKSFQEFNSQRRERFGEPQYATAAGLD